MPGIIFTRILNQFRGDGVGDVHLAVVVHAVLGVEVADGKVANAIEPDAFLVPVVRVARNLDVVVESPGLEDEGTVAD